jgi:lysophospholipase L1-like esterase
MMKRIIVCSALLVAILALSRYDAEAQTQNQLAREHWVGTWSTALTPRTQPAAPNADGASARERGGRGDAAVEPTNRRLPNGFVDSNPQDANAPRTFENQTYRQNMASTIGGNRVRVVFSNRFGQTPLAIGAASIALRGKGSAIVPESARPLTFGGATSIRIPARADYVSDAVAFDLPARTQFTVDMFLPDVVGTATSPATFHLSAFNDSYVSRPGNHVSAADFPMPRDTQSTYFIARVEVIAPASTGAVVVLGDSTTDGARNGLTNVRWPEVLADRLNAASGPRMAVLNAGHGGNSLLRSGAADASIARFDRDVLSLAGVTHLIVHQGITDIRANDAPSLEEMLNGYRQLIYRARAHGIKVIGATLTPIGKTNGYNEVSAAKWDAINNWIRTSGEFDGVIDFAKLLADPANPHVYQAELTTDYTHPSEAGSIKMGNAIDLSLITVAASSSARR